MKTSITILLALVLSAQTAFGMDVRVVRLAQKIPAGDGALLIRGVHRSAAVVVGHDADRIADQLGKKIDSTRDIIVFTGSAIDQRAVAENLVTRSVKEISSGTSELLSYLQSRKLSHALKSGLGSMEIDLQTESSSENFSGLDLGGGASFLGGLALENPFIFLGCIALLPLCAMLPTIAFAGM